MQNSFPSSYDQTYANDLNNMDNMSELETTGPEKKFWTESEDRILEQLVDEFKEIYGMKHNWAEISKQLPGRTREQCRKRWRYKLDPQMKHDKWTTEEDDILLKLHATLGNKWAKIGKIINGRSDVEVKNHYYALQRKVKNEEEMMRCLEKVSQKPMKTNITDQPLYVPDSEKNAIHQQHFPYPNYPGPIPLQRPQTSLLLKSPEDMTTYFKSMDSCRPSGLVINKAPSNAYPVTITQPAHNDSNHMPMYSNHQLQLNFHHRPPSINMNGMPTFMNLHNGTTGGHKRKAEEFDGGAHHFNPFHVNV